MTKSKRFLIIVFIMLIELDIVTSSSDESFPKILWTYWDSGLKNVNIFTKLCVNNMIHYTKESNWEFKFLTKNNYTNYLSKESQQRMKAMFSASNKYKLQTQNEADIMRLFLIYENGGMWVDTNTVFLRDLKWVEFLNQQTNISNKIGNYPQYFAFTYHIYSGNQSKTIHQDLNIQIQFFPGLEIWAFAAMKGSLFLKDVILQLEESLKFQRHILDIQHKEMGIKYGYQNDHYFFTSNYQFQTVLQKKQKQIQDNPSKFNTKYAVQYYKIWSIPSQISAFYLAEDLSFDSNIMYKILMNTNFSEYKQKPNVKNYLFKFVNLNYKQIGFSLENVLPYQYCEPNKTFFKNYSFINQQLFQYSGDNQLVKHLKGLNFDEEYRLNHQKDCQQYINIEQLVFSNEKILNFMSVVSIVLLIWLFSLYFFIKQINSSNLSTLTEISLFEQEKQEMDNDSI